MTKKLMLFVLVGLFMVSFSSAWQFDNVKNYNPSNREMTIENGLGFGDDVAKIKLNTPLNFKVPRGYQLVAEFDLTYYLDDNGGLDLMDFYNVNSGMKKIDREFDFKIKEVTQKLVDDTECSIVNNETICEVIGSHYEDVVKWKNFNQGQLKKAEQVTIGVFTNVEKGDKIEWIPTFYGVEIDEWATWEDSLDVGLIAYWKLNGTTGTVVDETGNFNGVNEGATRGGAGVINNSFYFDGTNDWINVSMADQSYDKLTFSTWFRRNDSDTEDYILSGMEDAMGPYIRVKNPGTTFSVYRDAPSAGFVSASITFTPVVGTWYHVVGTFNGTHARIYLNGELNDTTTVALSTLRTFQLDDIGAYQFGSNFFFNGTIDEVGVWNRSLSSSEVSDLYNSGDGLTFGQNETITITLNSPDDNKAEVSNTNITFNITSQVAGSTLTNISLYIDGILNETKSISGILDTETFIKSFKILSSYEWGVEVCNSINVCKFSDNRTLVITKIIENSRTHNTTAYDTSSETYSINVTANSSLTAVNLLFNGTSFVMTDQGSGVWSFTRNIPVSVVGNNSINFSFTYAGDTLYSDTLTYQNVLSTVFGLCNATLSTEFLNISFKDESDSSVINASIPSSTFVYWLGDGTVTKTLNFINNSNNFDYTFCGTPNRTLNINSFVQYKQGTAYPQRIYNQEDGILTNISTDLTLYLLGVSDGQFVTFQVFSGQSAVIEGADVTATISIGGSDIAVGQGTTDAAGTVTFWLNPDFLHRFTFVKTGFETVIETLTPSQTLYTITMGGGTASTVIDNAEGIFITTLPQGSFLDANTEYTFQYTINSSSLTLTEYGFELFYNNGSSIFSDTGTTSTGGTLSTLFNTTNNTRLEMTYYYITNGTTVEGTTYWLIASTNDFSIFHFFTRVTTYISANIFGILGDDNGYFAKAIISILILILVTGTISMRYGLGSEAAVTGLLFGVVFMLNTFNLIPTPDFLTFINLGDFLVFLVAMFGISIILKEERR